MTNQQSTSTPAVFRRYLTEDEERRLFALLSGLSDVYARRDHAWMRLLRQTGIRVGALSQLRVMDATEALSTGRLNLRSEIQKRGIEHGVFTNKRAKTALRDMLSIRAELGYAAIPEMPLVMSRQRDRALSVRSYQSRMRLWLSAAGLGALGASPHWWRHTLGKRLMERSTARDPRGIVQGVLGHRSIASTAVYTRPDREDLETSLEEAS